MEAHAVQVEGFQRQMQLTKMQIKLHPGRSQVGGEVDGLQRNAIHGECPALPFGGLGCYRAIRSEGINNELEVEGAICVLSQICSCIGQ